MNHRKIVLRKLSKMSKDKIKRIEQFRRMVLNMPYTDTHYVYKSYPGSLFQEEEFDIRSGK